VDSISRPAYAAAVARLAEFASGERPVALAGVGEEVLAVAALLAREPGLRRALADPSRDGSARADLLDSLLEDRTTSDTRDVLRLLVAGRWGGGSELRDAVELVGVQALLASADSAGELSDVGDELFRFGQIVDGSPELAMQLGTSTVPAGRRAELAHALLDGRAHRVTIRLVELALNGFGGRTFTWALERLVELVAARQERQLAFVTVAHGLTEAETERLAAALSRHYGTAIELRMQLDPTIVGGVLVRIGSDRYDATVLRRLMQARTALAAR
jgi:F-type H+-transporting ATPase subunit delta